ncbi:hypothetical protein [Pseudomonas aeruginosa]|uniref:hypothetical protein n=1 Tax=Pseudomonas aeruginosa TaxID=287 RepID=UPI000EB32818|nr:hypothetical protein [Pseudomonas aeruginosa]HBO3146288.1 hypothetical protein [Pseudomonas aeruginosa]HCL4166282.1 hypothetical protein [Pseudomonas aeruginosa]
MSKSDDPIVDHLYLLYYGREYLAQAYSQGYIVRTPENAKTLARLQQVRALRVNPNVEDSYRLSPSLNKYLEEVTHKSRSFGISSNFKDQIDRLYKLSDQYSQAHFELREDDRDGYLSEFDGGVFEISESMNDFLMLVNTACKNNFANVTTSSEKIRQNEHYLEQMRNLDEALLALTNADFLYELESEEKQPLSLAYDRHILANTARWRATLSGIITVLRAYLHKLRRIEPRAKRIRAMQMFLHRHPEYEVRDPDEYPSIPEWAYQVSPMEIALYVDINRQDVREALSHIASTIERVAPEERQVREAGEYVEDEEPETMKIKVKPIVAVTARMLTAAANSIERISAKRFIYEAPETQALDLKANMVCFVAMLQFQIEQQTRLVRPLRIEFDSVGEDDPLAGNIVIRDVYLCKRA